MLTKLLPLADLVTIAGSLFLFFRLSRQEARPAWAMPLLCAMAALALFAISEPRHLFEDFRVAYYLAGQAVLDGPAALGPQIERGVDGFVNLPVVAYLFTPFALLPDKAAAVLFTLIGLAATAGAFLLLARLAGLRGTGFWLLLLLFAINGPLHNSLKEGNTTHIVLLLLAAGLWLLRGRRDVAAGLLLGFAAVIKLPLMLFGLYFLLRRNWGATAGFAGFCGAAGLLSLAIFGWEMHWHWLQLSVLQFSSHPLGAFNVQSVAGFLVRLAEGPAALMDWETLRTPAPLQRMTGTVAVGLLYLTALLACVRGSAQGARTGGSRGQDLEYALVLVLAVVSSPLSWSHYYLLMLLPAAFFLAPGSALAASPARRALGWAAILLTTPAVLVIAFANPGLMEAYARFGVSYLLFGGLLWFGLLAWSRARAASPQGFGLGGRATQPLAGS
ncbi:hypothetical protein RGI145_18185 [Roseomonas gilardii]|uniref:Polyprenol-phosphate-mannose-dependent alpha-(1-2)-phosphatidylinositol pentamannoside mannosyltransferase n=1 Tax=Roseomonas gilardii TaxID=257708 RepID=A0A1L7AIX6_9PROT|nr:glycosyltransferase family 87 protein [Roseomonas gilardii]APT58747.1 hypothetical protein RGI145_18185 [Roseomonas gilardii]